MKDEPLYVMRRKFRSGHALYVKECLETCTGSYIWRGTTFISKAVRYTHEGACFVASCSERQCEVLPFAAG